MDSSVEKLQKVLKLYNEILKVDENLDLANIYYNIGIGYKKQGNFDLAHKSFQNSLRIQNRIFNENEHESIISTLKLIADTYFEQNKFDLSFEYFEKSYKMSRNVYGKDHVKLKECIILMNNICQGKKYLISKLFK